MSTLDLAAWWALVEAWGAELLDKQLLPRRPNAGASAAVLVTRISRGRVWVKYPSGHLVNLTAPELQKRWNTRLPEPPPAPEHAAVGLGDLTPQGFARAFQSCGAPPAMKAHAGSADATRRLITLLHEAEQRLKD